MKLNDVDLNKVATFCRIVECGNYRRAAEALNVTPSALSQTVSRLEHSLGFPLFHRIGKKLIPTDAGLTLNREFERSHENLRMALEGLSRDRDQVQGLLRVGAYLEFAKTHLSRPSGEFLRRYPEAQLKFTFDTPTRLQRALENDRLDLCFSIYPSIEGRAIASRPVYHEELVLISAERLISDQPTYEEILATPMVEYYFNHQPMLRWLWLHYRKKPKKLPIRAYASTAEMLLSLVAAGAGLGVVPRYLLDSVPRTRSHVKIVRPSEKKCRDHIWMLERRQAHRSPVHEAYTRSICEHFKLAP